MNRLPGKISATCLVAFLIAASLPCDAEEGWQALPKFNTYFQFRSEDSSDDAQDRATSTLAINFEASYSFAEPAFNGYFKVKYSGTLEEDEAIQSLTETARLDQKYKMNLGLSTKDNLLSMSSEFSTRDKFSRRNRFDSLLSTTTFQTLSGSVSIKKPPYPELTGSVSSQRNVQKTGAFSSSVNQSAFLVAVWSVDPIKITVSKARTESRIDLAPTSVNSSEQTTVSATGFYSLGKGWRMIHNFNYSESLKFLAGGTEDRNQVTGVQLRLSRSELLPGLSISADLRGQQAVFASSATGTKNFSQGINLVYNPPGELIGNDSLTFSFTNTDTESGGSPRNTREHAIGWRFIPVPGSNVTIVYRGKTSGDTEKRIRTNEETWWDLRFSYSKDRFGLNGRFVLNLNEGASGVESRTNSLTLNMSYKVSDPLKLSLSVNHNENRNIPANPLGLVNVSERLGLALGVNWKPVTNFSLDVQYKRDDLNNSTGSDSSKESISAKLRFQATQQIGFTLDFDSNDFESFGDFPTDRRNTIITTTVNFNF